jgi:GNAT superfamily N-acetyltransferase
VARALRLRAEVAVYAAADACGVVILGRGLAGRRELSFEVAPEYRGRGLGRRLVAAALALVPEETPVFAQASPGNAASLRALLAAGFLPIGSEVLFVTHAP